MRILVAEDELITRKALEVTLVRAGHEVVVCSDGEQAWQALSQADAPELVILDWLMPRVDGIEICRRVRATKRPVSAYLILLTWRSGPQHIVEGLRAGADDYVEKPFNSDELLARVQVGTRMVQLQRSLADRVRELETLLARVRHLEGLLPICSYCKKIRDDQNYWHQVEEFVAQHSNVQFSHGICPDCFDRVTSGPEFSGIRAAVRR